MHNEYKKLVSRLDDLIYISKNDGKVTSTNFLNQEELTIAKNYIGKAYPYRIYGGYDNAEYCKIFFLDSDYDDIVCLKAKFNQKYYEITHRDILGSLMSLSINRNQVGDFFVEDGYVYLYTTAQFSKFLIDNFIQIKQCSVKFEINETNKERTVKKLYFEKIINSPRIDNIVGAIMNCSRKEAQDIIKDDRVKINHIPIAELSKLCNNDCMISIRGKGRFIYKGIIKTTKKDRILIGMEKFV